MKTLKLDGTKTARLVAVAAVSPLQFSPRLILANSFIRARQGSGPARRLSVVELFWEFGSAHEGELHDEEESV